MGLPYCIVFTLDFAAVKQVLPETDVLNMYWLVRGVIHPEVTLCWQDAELQLLTLNLAILRALQLFMLTQKDAQFSYIADDNSNKGEYRGSTFLLFLVWFLFSFLKLRVMHQNGLVTGYIYTYCCEMSCYPPPPPPSFFLLHWKGWAAFHQGFHNSIPPILKWSMISEWYTRSSCHQPLFW